MTSASQALPARTFTVVPHTPNCRRVLSLGDHVLIGISAHNSHFSIPAIAQLMRWGHDVFRRMDLVCPDKSMTLTYQALGYSEEAAAAKTRKEVSGVRRRIRRAWELSGVPAAQQHTHLLSDLAKASSYDTRRQAVQRALAEDKRLYDVCYKMSSRILSGIRKPDGEQFRGEGADRDTAGLEGRVELAMEYLIDELPFFVDTPAILGVPSSIVSYHMPLPFADLIYTGRSVLSAASDQGYVLLQENSE